MTSTSDTLDHAARLPLLCDVGWHRPDATPRWNNGYYFTTCTRCGHDLIRTAFGKWHVPRGYRVVWQAQPPAGTMTAALAGHDVAPVATDDLEQRIVREVIRQLRDADPASEGAAPPSVEEDAPPPEPEVEAPPADPPRVARRSIVPDFMDDGWPSPPPPMAYRPLPDHHDDAPSPPDPASPSALDMLRGWRDNARRMAAPRARAPRRESSARWQTAAMIGLLLVIIASAAWVSLDRDIADAANRPLPDMTTKIDSDPQAAVPAYVTASTLNCRSAPARQAAVVARLTRGMPVGALARDGQWVSLSIAGNQCWALGRYVSVDPPI